MSFSNLDFVVVVSAANVVLFFFLVLAKMDVPDVSQKYDVINRIFEILKYQNFPVLTVWPIVPITFLILNNHQSGRLAAKNSNSAEIAFFTFWSNVTLVGLVQGMYYPGTDAAEAEELKNEKLN